VKGSRESDEEEWKDIVDSVKEMREGKQRRNYPYREVVGADGEMALWFEHDRETRYKREGEPGDLQMRWSSTKLLV
jgi:hypothetical protein